MVWWLEGGSATPTGPQPSSNCVKWRSRSCLYCKRVQASYKPKSRVSDVSPQCFSAHFCKHKWGASKKSSLRSTEDSGVHNTTIPGIEMVVFSGLRSTGPKDSNSKNIIREMDSSVFAQYKKKQYCIFFEIKCCDIHFTQKDLNRHRKHARSRLQNHINIFENCSSVNSNKSNKIHIHAIWPNNICPRVKYVWFPIKLTKHFVRNQWVAGPKEGMQQAPQYEQEGFHMFQKTCQPITFETFLKK